MTFPDLLFEVAANRDFVREYDRLRGTCLSKLGTRSALEAMIDSATGREEGDLARFVEDVYDLFWLRMPRDTALSLGGEST